MKFSGSEVRRFTQLHRSGVFGEQRLGQAFCSHFKLHKSLPGRALEDRLWEKDGAAARSVIESHTDWNQ